MTSTPPTESFSSLSLSLSRDQGPHHSSSGAGSESLSLSHAAEHHHSVVAERILSQSSAKGVLALDPARLPMAPSELPKPKEGEREEEVDGLVNGAGGGGGGDKLTGEALEKQDKMFSLEQEEGVPKPTTTAPVVNGVASATTNNHSTTPTPTSSGTASPALVPHSIPLVGGGVGGVPHSHSHLVPPGSVSSSTTTPPNNVSSAVATPGVSRSGTPSSAQMVVNKSSGASSTHTAKDKGEKGEKKSVFGKLFERGNVSSNSLQAGNGGGSVSGNSGNGDEGHHHKTGGGEGGAPLGRKPSRKEEKDRKAEEKREKKEAEKLLRVPSGKGEERKDNKDKTAGEEKSAGVRSRSSSKGEGGDGGGGGGVFGDFLKRKTSVTSKRSDDGKSERGGSQAGESHYSGNGGGGGGSKGGQTTASLLKKYGVCEKVAIGKGATATVKLAHKWDRSTERLYAVKEFRKRRKNETEKEYVKKLTSEFCISSTLHHQNIVETVDLVQDEQNHWCEVMEYCPGGDLYAAIKKGSMTTEEINSYFKQILSGVTYLHSMGVAHRDIKPENLLLDARGHVKITDFGVSDVFRMCWEKTTHLSKGLCGSEPYIAPEQFEQKEYDARQVDVWACAVVFYCMHFQELPWRVAKPSDPSFGPYIQLYSASAPAPAPLSNLVPRECRQVIKRMLDPDPKTRMTTEMIANDPWFRSIVVVPPLEGLPVPAAAVTPAAHAQ